MNDSLETDIRVRTAAVLKTEEGMSCIQFEVIRGCPPSPPVPTSMNSGESDLGEQLPTQRLTIPQDCLKDLLVRALLVARSREALVNPKKREAVKGAA